MFHWICPECGCEIPPTVKECAACDPKAVADLSPVEAAPPPTAEPVVQAQKSEPVEELAPDPMLVLAEHVRAIQRVHGGAPRVEAKAQPVADEPKPTPVAAPIPVVAPPVEIELKFEPANEIAKHSTKVEPEPSAVEIALGPTNLLELAAVIGVSEIAALPEPDLNDSGESETEPSDETEFQETPPEPVPAHAASPRETSMQEANVTLALLAAPVARQTLASLIAPVPPVRDPISTDLVALAATSTVAAAKPIAVNESLFESRLALAPLQDYSAAASRAIHPAQPNPAVSMPDSGPRITLPGPTLPPELISLHGAKVVTVLGEQPRASKRAGFPGWVVSLLVMTALLVVGIGLVFFALPMGRSNGDAKAAPTDVPPSVAQANTFPIAQSVEVTGFRIVVDFNKKSEIHYLLVNHSAAELSDMTVYVTLQSAKAKPGQAPICRFSFRSPSLGPFESKEMTSPIEKLPRAATLPEWADLRADVQVTQ